MANKPAKKSYLAKASSHDKLVAGLVDELYQTRAKRYELNKQADALETREKEIRKELIAVLPRFGATGVAGKVARAQLESKPIVIVADWPALRKYIKRHDAWDLLQQRVNTTAVGDRWAAKKVVAGVRADNVTVVSLHKL